MRDNTGWVISILQGIVLFIWLFAAYNTYCNIKDIKDNTSRSAYYLEQIYNTK